MKKIVLLILLFSFLISLQSALAVDKAKLRWLRDKPIIDSIAINGNKAFSVSEIRGRMYSRTQSLWRKIKKDRRMKVQRETLGRDTLEIKYLYLTKGYLNIQVSETFLPLEKYQKVKKERSNDSIPMAMIWVNIDEGSQYSYGQHTLQGEFDGKFRWPLTQKIEKLKENNPTNPLEIFKIIFDMRTELANNGYPYSTITYDIDTTREFGKADITFSVQSDSLVHFGDITIDTVGHFPAYVGMRELKIKKGDVYSRKSILDYQKRLFESGYFSFSQLAQSEISGNRLHPDFVLKYRERKSKFLSLASGVGQSEVKDLQWDLNFGFGKRNVDFTRFKIKNGGHRFSAFADYSFSVGSDSRLITHRYSLRYTTPWTFGIRMPLTLTFEIEPPLKSQLGDFTIQQWAFSAKTSKWFGEEIRTTAGLEYNNVKLDTNIVLPQELEDISIRRKLFSTFRLDSRDNIFLPTKGQLSELSTEYFGGFLGGDNNFYKIEASWATYQKIWPGWIIAVRMKGGVAKEFGKSVEVPIDEKLYLGGANTIRGYTENSLGPVRLEIDSANVLHDTNFVAIGANYSIVLNQEFRWKTVQFLNVLPFVGNLFKKFPQWQSLFIDAGNGFGSSREIKFDQFAFAYGTGFQIVSPAGPIRIDYARRIKTDRYDVDSRWHFTILYAF